MHGMSGTAEEVGHRVVGGAAIGTGYIGPAYRVAVGLKPGTMAGTELGEGRCGMTVVAVVRLGQLEGGSHKHLVGRLGPDGLLYHTAPEEASGHGVSTLFQHAHEDESKGGVGAVTSDSQASEWAVV